LVSWRIRDVATLGVALALAARPAAAQQPTLATVLERAGAYVTEFQRQLSGIVAEERYAQEITAFPKRGGCRPASTYQSTLNCRGQLVIPIRADLRSDLLLVKPIGANEWVQFRDVFEADGKPVRDRADRLTRLFLNESRSARIQVGRILEESARFNIGEITRNVNVPVFALQFLLPANQGRFRFSRTKHHVPDTFTRDDAPTGAFRTSTEVWIVEYRETQTGTMIRTSERKDLPSRGRFWIEPTTGRVLMSELIVRNRTVAATIDVSYQSEPLVGLLVPIEMRERYASPTGERIKADATYGQFRQFQVNVDETFTPIIRK
jgi:hypothetical protein